MSSSCARTLRCRRRIERRAAREVLPGNIQNAADHRITVETDPGIVDDEDAVEDVLKHGSELTIGSVGGAVAGALLQPDEAEIQGEEQHAKADADEQSRDESTGKPGGIDSRTERKKKAGTPPTRAGAEN